MAIVTGEAKLLNALKESMRAWNWLKRCAQYKIDYTYQQTSGPSLSKKFRENMLKTYGFYPLIDPFLKQPSDFHFEFCWMFGQIPSKSSINPIKPSYVDIFLVSRKKIKPVLPKQVTIQIDPTKPVNLILEELKKYLNHLRKTYKIKEKRSPMENLHMIYILRTLKNLGMKEDRILKKFRDSLKDEATKESELKRFLRLIKKTETNKF